MLQCALVCKFNFINSTNVGLNSQVAKSESNFQKMKTFSMVKSRRRFRACLTYLRTSTPRAVSEDRDSHPCFTAVSISLTQTAEQPCLTTSSRSVVFNTAGWVSLVTNTSRNRSFSRPCITFLIPATKMDLSYEKTLHLNKKINAGCTCVSF